MFAYGSRFGVLACASYARVGIRASEMASDVHVLEAAAGLRLDIPDNVDPLGFLRHFRSLLGTI
jgi:hypothetical protein